MEPEPGRPRLPASYGVDPRPTGREVAWSDALRRLAEARNYWLATAGPGGTPHSVPVWGVWLGDAFLFATDPASRKARNLGARPDVVVHLESGDDVLIVDGQAAAVRDPCLLARFADAYEAKYAFRPDTAGSAVYAVSPRSALAWLEADFPGTAARWTFGGD